MSDTSKKPYHHDDLRGSLIRVAREHVQAAGEGALSLRAVARDVGVSPSAAYHHFEDREALLFAVGATGHEELHRRLAGAAASVEGEGREAAILRFRAIGEAYVRFALEEPNLFRLCFGPVCGAKAMGGDEPDPAFAVLVGGLDELERTGAFPGGVQRPGADLVFWSTVHGFANLVLEGLLPPEAAPELFGAIAALVFG